MSCLRWLTYWGFAGDKAKEESQMFANIDSARDSRHSFDVARGRRWTRLRGVTNLNIYRHQKLIRFNDSVWTNRRRGKCKPRAEGSVCTAWRQPRRHSEELSIGDHHQNTFSHWNEIASMTIESQTLQINVNLLNKSLRARFLAPRTRWDERKEGERRMD